MVYAFLDTMSSYANRVSKSNKLKLVGTRKYQFTEVPIIGFNSAKFDMNLLVKYLSGKNYKIISTLEKSSYYKCLKAETQVMVGKKEIQVTLRFVDAMIYAPGCTLDQFTQDYTEKKVVERVKGFFP
jgi:hypothetical protein